MIGHALLLQVEPTVLESLLDTLLLDMVKQSSKFIGLGQALGGLGAICYIFFRIWGHLSRNEEIDVFPLFRPFVLAICLLAYPGIASGLAVINQSLNASTASFVTSQRGIVDNLNQQKDKALLDKQDELTAFAPEASTGTGISGWIDRMEKLTTAGVAYIGKQINYYASKFFDEFLKTIGELLYDVAAIALKFLQTFFLLVMLVTGPITLGLACFDWFYSGLASWLARVINLMLWLPLVNLLGGMLETVHIAMLRADIYQIQNTPASTFTQADFGLITFYLLGSIGYLMVPTVAGWIVESSGAGNAISTGLAGAKASGAVAGSAGGAATGAAKGAVRGIASVPGRVYNSI